jgi:hypothetical protein
MVGTANIVTGDYRDKGSSAVCACRLDATESVGLDGSCRAVTVALSLYAGVYTSGVGAPKLNVCISDGFAARRIDDVDIEMCDGALLARQEILTNKFASDPYQPLDFRPVSESAFQCLQYGPSVASGSSVQVASIP